MNNTSLVEDDFLTMDEIYEGRRKLPRFELDTIMTILTKDGIEVSAQMNNISLDGAQINCDKETAKIIMPKTTSIVEKQQPIINGEFNLSVEGKDHIIKMECKIYYVVSLDGKTVTFGLLFEDNKTGNNEVLEKFIEKSMESYL